MLKDDVIAYKKERIIEAAGQLFFEKGYALTTLDDIAAALSVRKPFVYQFFEGKLELLSEVCGTTTAYASGIAQLALDASGSPTVRLSRMVRALALEIIKERVALAVCFREEKHLPPAGLLRLQEDRRHFIRALRLLLDEGRSKGEFSFADANVAAQAITGMTTWIYIWYRPGGPMQPDELAAESAAMALRLVGAAP